jgi:RNA polymerase sigma-70 factor (ECF subfamily)
MNAVTRHAHDLHRLSEADLIALARSGAAAAFREIMQRNNQRLFRVARSVLKNDTEAEDVLQETYLKAFRHLGDFRGEARLSTWLTRVALNEALGRKRKERPTVELETGERSATKPGAEVIPLFAGTNDTPEQDAARHEIRRVLEGAIDRLPEDFRTVFVMRVVEDMSIEETAGALELNPATVKTRLHRARALLKAEVESAFGAVLTDAFPFLGRRCARVTEAVLERLGLPP